MAANTIVIDWFTSDDILFPQQKTETFKEAVYLSNNQNIPLYHIHIPSVNGQLVLNQSSFQFEIFEGKVADKNKLSSTISFQIAPVKAKQNKGVDISCLPLRINPTTGETEKLVAFEYEIIQNTTTTFAKKSLKSTKTTSVLSAGTWHKICVQSDDVYKIDFAFLEDNNISSGNLSFSNIGVFGQGVGVLPEANSVSRVDDLEEVSLKIIDNNNNGQWESDDYILFYAKGPHVWSYDTINDQWKHTFNIYSDEACYFFTPNQGSGKVIPTISSPSVSNNIVSTYEHRYFFEEDIYNLIYTILPSTMGSGREWFGEQLTSINPSQEITVNLPNSNLGSSSIRIRYAANSFVSGSNFTLVNNGNTVLSSIVNMVPGGSFSSAGNANLINNSISISATNQFSIQFSCPSDPQASGYLDFLELITPSNLAIEKNTLFFQNAEAVANGLVNEYRINNANSNYEVWEITNAVDIHKLNYTLNGSQLVFNANADTIREFVAVNVNASNYSNPNYKKPIANQNLHGLPQRDMLIITVGEFLSAADRLADFHRGNGISTAVVDVEQIYNEFSSGQQDLTAIRDFIKMFYDRSTSQADAPKYVLLFGDASFDYKDRISNNENFIPTYQSQESFSVVSSYCTDDYIAFLDANEGADITDLSNPNKVDVAVGRLPVDNLTEANGIVDKMLHYASTSSMNDWRNVLTFVADDEDNNLHFNQVELLTGLTTIEEKDYYNFKKIYLDAFTQTNAAGGDRYPDVNDAIIRSIRAGSFLINYTGHGGPKNWAQERVFNIEDIRQLENIDNLPLFITATCDFSPYDDTDFHSAGESLITNEKGGAIALITTTRLVFAYQNFDMNSRVLDYLFQEYNGRKPTIGEILLEAKNGAAATENNRKFVLMGDPALTLAYPKYEVVTTSINGQPITQIDTLRALSKVTIEGEIHDGSGSLLSGFNGVVYPSVYDKIAEYQTKGQDQESDIDNFDLQNNILFKGKASVKNGKFQFEFIVPKDINYAFDEGKLSYYAAENNSLNDAHGYSFDFIVGGTADSIVPDNQGPIVDVFINDTTFAFGGLTDENPLLLVNLEDESGINTIGNGIGHDIIGLLNENTQNQYQLNDFYEAVLDDFTKGSIEFPFNQLEDGRYSIRVKAWDVHNNPGEGYTEFVVARSEELALQHVLNYPNPFFNQTSFIFEHNRPGEILDVQIQIYTVSGRVVKTIQTSLVSEGYRVGPNEITWDGLDDFGDAIGKGVYVYKVKVSSENGYHAQEFEKLVILR